MPSKIAKVPVLSEPTPASLAATQRATQLLRMVIDGQPRRALEALRPTPRRELLMATDGGNGGERAADEQAFVKPQELLDATVPIPVADVWAADAPTISAAKLRETLVAQFPAASLRPPEEFDDDNYLLPPLAVAQAIFAERRWLNLTKRNVFYWRQVYDCDDFAYALRAAFSIHHFENASVQDREAGIAAGIMMCGNANIGRHMLNCVVTSDQGVWVFDATPTSQGQYEARLLGLPVSYVVI